MRSKSFLCSVCFFCLIPPSSCAFLVMHTPSSKSQQRGGGGGGGGGGARPPRTPGGGGAAAGASASASASASPSPSSSPSPTAGVGASSLTFSASKHVRSMKDKKAATTNRAQSRTLFKPALATPFAMPWYDSPPSPPHPPISQRAPHGLLTLIAAARTSRHHGTQRSYHAATRPLSCCCCWLLLPLPLLSPFVCLRRNPLSVQQSLQVIDLLQQGVRERHSSMAAAASAHTTAASAAPATAAVAVPSGSAAASHKRKRDDSAAPTGELESSATDEQRDGICMGINAVTRAAEQGQRTADDTAIVPVRLRGSGVPIPAGAPIAHRRCSVHTLRAPQFVSAGTASVLIVCRSVAPLSLIAHLPVLCHLRQLPLITLHPHVNSRMLAQALQAAAPQPQLPSGSTRNNGSSSARGVQLCMALAIKVSSHRQLHGRRLPLHA